MKVRVRLQSAAQPIEFDAESTYQKGDFYCIKLGDTVVKYPVDHIFSVSEDYGYTEGRAPVPPSPGREGHGIDWSR